MKLFIIMLLALPSWAKMPQILRCLAEEEYSIHKESSKQHLYRLNQLLVNEFAAADTIELVPEKLQYICSHSPSEELLRALLIEGKKIFYKSPTLLENERYLVQASIDSLLDRATTIFFQYLLVLEDNVGVANCLRQKIPEIRYFSEQFQNLETEVRRERLLQNKNKIIKIFDDMKNFDAIKKSCQRTPPPKS